MNIDKNTMELISRIEFIIGSQCYNPNALKDKKRKNNSKGDKGLIYKFPLSYKKGKTLIKAECGLGDLPKQHMNTAEYAFGSNHLLIGEGILKVLEELENRYEIDFCELEKDRIKRRKAAMKRIKKELQKDSESEIYAGIYECGLDIEEGEYTLIADEEANISVKRTEKSRRKDLKFVLKSNSGKNIKLYKGDILDSDKMLLLKQ